MKPTQSMTCTLLMLCALIFGAAMTGCGEAKGREGGSDLKTLARYYLAYFRSHDRNVPANEQALREYITSFSIEDRKKLNAENVDDVFVSSRDGKSYVVIYGENTNGNMPPVIAYEAEGINGKRWVAHDLGYVGELDDAEFKKLDIATP